uniref:Uncharacterized protein n=1 Tax=viral metagenome TaxID=1070528 RepID=A0A6H2A146_9ZZZZ
MKPPGGERWRQYVCPECEQRFKRRTEFVEIPYGPSGFVSGPIKALHVTCHYRRLKKDDIDSVPSSLI